MTKLAMVLYSPPCMATAGHTSVTLRMKRGAGALYMPQTQHGILCGRNHAKRRHKYHERCTTSIYDPSSSKLKRICTHTCMSEILAYPQITEVTTCIITNYANTSIATLVKYNAPGQSEACSM